MSNFSSKFIPALVGAVLMAISMGPLSAEKFRPEGFHYYKKLSGPSSAAKATYGRLTLDARAIAHSGRYDLVVSRDGVEVPSFTRAVPPVPGRSGTRKAQLLYNRVARGRRVILVKLPEIPVGSQYVSIKLSSNTRFEGSVQLIGGTSPQVNYRLGSYNIYRYGGYKVDKIRFRGGANRFFKLEVDGDLRKRTRFAVVNATFADKSRVSEFKTSLKLKDLRISSNSDKNSSLYYYENENRNKIRRLVLTFKEDSYNRRVHVYNRAGRNKGYKKLARVRLARRGKDPRAERKQVVDFQYPVSGALKIEVRNGDDAPLTLTAIEAYSPLEEIVFRLPKTGGDLRLYYGNRYLTPREYDIEQTYEKRARHLKYTAGAHTKNEKFSYSVLEPPLSSWIIRILFWLGLLGLAFPAFKIFTAYAKDMTPRGAGESS